jgi:hypothetical protein
MVNGQNPFDFTAVPCVVACPQFSTRSRLAAIVPISLAGAREEFVKFGFQLSDFRLSRGVKGKTLSLDRYC